MVRAPHELDFSLYLRRLECGARAMRSFERNLRWGQRRSLPTFQPITRLRSAQAKSADARLFRPDEQTLVEPGGGGEAPCLGAGCGLFWNRLGESAARGTKSTLLHRRCRTTSNILADEKSSCAGFSKHHIDVARLTGGDPGPLAGSSGPRNQDRSGLQANSASLPRAWV